MPEVEEKEPNPFEADFKAYEGLTVEEPPKAQDGHPSGEQSEKPVQEAEPEEVKEEEKPPAVEKPPVEAKTEAPPPEPIKVEEKRSPALTDEQYLEEVRKKRAELLPKIEESYNIEDEDIEAFVSGDVEAVRKVLKKLAANVYLDSFEANQMINRAQLPGMVKSLREQEVEETSSNEDFYSKWPELKKAEYQETIRKVVGTYRALNPKAEMSEVVTNTGAMAMQALGLQRNGQASSEETKPAPPQPAGPGATGGSVNPPVSENPFTRDYELFKDMY